MKKSKIRRINEKVKPYLFLVPIITFAIGFVYYPFIRTFMYSFSLVNFKGEIIEFVGLKNFIDLFANENFQNALKITLLHTACVVPLTLLCSLSLALLAAKKRKFSSLYETMFTMPMAMAMSSTSMVFKLLLNPSVGIVNHILGIDLSWFQSPDTALFGIILICVWVGIPFDFLLFLAAVRGVPEQLVEAAKIDGASYLRRLYKVILPLITPTILYLVCTNIVLAMMTVAPVMLITEGGPVRSTTTLIFMMFSSGYQSSNYSTASAISIVTFLLTFGIVALSMIFERKKVHYD